MTGNDFLALKLPTGFFVMSFLSLLGIWKLVELVLWLFNHVTVGIK